MAIGIDPTVDFACKLLLGSPDHPAITLHFLNAVLVPTPSITSVEILNPIVGQGFEDDKLSILDILAQDITGKMFDIEVQRTLQAGLAERLTYYAATQLVDQIGERDSYRLLRPSIGICILDAKLFPQIADYHLEFQLRTPQGVSLTDCLQIHLLELPKYSPPSDNRVIVDPLDQWAYFFRRAHGSSPEELASRLSDPVFAEATGVLEMIARSPEERRLYAARIKMQRDEQARLEDAIEQGKLEGEIKGRLEGKLEGKLEGRIRTLQEILGLPVIPDEEFQTMNVDQLNSLASELQVKLRERQRS